VAPKTAQVSQRIDQAKPKYSPGKSTKSQLSRSTKF